MSGTLPSKPQDKLRGYISQVFNLAVILLTLVQIVLLAVIVLTSLNTSLGFGLAISRKITWDIIIGIFFVIAVAYYRRLRKKVLLVISYTGLLSYIILRVWPFLS